MDCSTIYGIDKSKLDIAALKAAIAEDLQYADPGIYPDLQMMLSKDTLSEMLPFTGGCLVQFQEVLLFRDGLSVVDGDPYGEFFDRIFRDMNVLIPLTQVLG